MFSLAFANADSAKFVGLTTYRRMSASEYLYIYQTERQTSGDCLENKSQPKIWVPAAKGRTELESVNKKITNHLAAELHIRYL